MSEVFVVELGALKEFSITKIVNILESTDSLVHLHSNWPDLAYNLGLSSVQVRSIRNASLINTIENTKEVIRLVLETWVERKDGKPTVEELYKVLEEMKLRDCWQKILDGLGLKAEGNRVCRKGRIDTNEITHFPLDQYTDVDGRWWGLSCLGLNYNPNDKRYVKPKGNAVAGVEKLGTIVVDLPDESKDYPEDKYKLPSTEPKGYALIMNILEDRTGAEEDTRNLEELISQLGYEVLPTEHVFYSNNARKSPKVSSIIDVFRSNLDKQERKYPGSVKSIMIVVGSHGVYDNIQTSDGKSVNLYRDIVRQFNHESCEVLKGKPKIFLVEACRPLTATDDASSAEVKRQVWENALEARKKDVDGYDMTDTLIVHACLPGFWALRNETFGSHFIYAFCKVAAAKAKDKDLVKLFSDDVPKEMKSMFKLDEGEHQMPVVEMWGVLNGTVYLNLLAQGETSVGVGQVGRK